MTTMLLGGLWHGANWTFVVWGGLHGLYLSIERVLRRRFAGYRPGPFALLALGLLTYLLVNLTWVFFRAADFPRAWQMLSGMLGLNAGTQPMLAGAHLIAVAIIVPGIVIAHWLMRNRTLESAIARTPAAIVGVLWALMAFCIAIEQGDGNAFIYFQF